MTRYQVHLTRAARAAATPAALAAAGLARADAQRILRSAVPVPFAFTDSRESAAAAIRRLRAAGLDGFAVSTPALRHFRPQPVKRIEFTPDRLGLLVAGHVRRVETRSVRAVVVGKIHSRREVSSKSDADPAVDAFLTYQVVGLPMKLRHHAPDSSRATTSEESFVVLFADEPFIVREEGFDYRGTLVKPEMTREGSLRRVIERIREACPAAAYDDSLYRKPQHVSMDRSSGMTTSGLVSTVTTTTVSGSTADRALGAAYVIGLAAGAT